jgi:hypothetical protein
MTESAVSGIFGADVEESVIRDSEKLVQEKYVKFFSDFVFIAVLNQSYS